MQERGKIPAWSDRPPGTQGELAKILKVGPGEGQKVVCLSRSMVGVFTHFFDGRTTPCTAQRNEDGEYTSLCHVDHSQTSTRWQGWIGVQLEKAPIPFMLSVTEATVRDAKGLLTMGGNLRGVRMLIFRSADSARSKLCCQFSISPIAWEGNLFPEPDVRGFLFRLWGMRPAEGTSQGVAEAADIVSAEILDAVVKGKPVKSQREQIERLKKTAVWKEMP